MVKLTGPSLSIGASGTLADLLTFGNLRGKPTLRKKPTPKQPRTKLQITGRAMLTFLSQQWTNLPNVQRETWTELALANEISEYNAYLKDNLERWRNGRYPTKKYPATETGTPVTGATFTVTGGVRHIKLEIEAAFAPNDGWTGMIFRTQAFPPFINPEDLVYIFKVDDLNLHSYHDTPLNPGRYYYEIRLTTNDANPTNFKSYTGFDDVT